MTIKPFIREYIDKVLVSAMANQRSRDLGMLWGRSKLRVRWSVKGGQWTAAWSGASGDQNQAAVAEIYSALWALQKTRGQNRL